MSLASAVLEIADAMEKDVEGLADEGPHGKIVAMMVGNHARMLRMAVKAAEGDVPKMPNIENLARKRVAREEADRMMVREGSGFNTAELVGGGMDGDLVEIDPKMPIGAKTAIAGRVWQLQSDRKLHLVEA